MVAISEINNGSGTVGGTADAVVGDNPSSSGYAGYFTGRVYIATGLNVNGTSVSGTCTSDERLKKDIQPMAKSLEILSKLRPVTYYWKNPEKDQSSKMLRGFIAQDVEKVMPEWVSTNDLGYKTVDTAGLTPMLVDSVKTLKAENDDLKTRLSALENSRKVVVAGNAWGFAVGGLALGLAMVVSRRKKDEEKSA